MAKFLDEHLFEFAIFKGSTMLVGQSTSDPFESLAVQLSTGLTGLGLMTLVPIIQ